MVSYDVTQQTNTKLDFNEIFRKVIETNLLV